MRDMLNFNAKKKKSNSPRIILVCGAKGGVGKSTICYNLALAAKNSGKKTAIVDADIYGPSIHHLCGLKQQAPEIKHNLMIPIVKNGLQINSMGFLIPSEKALVWRGPMITKALNNLINNTVWEDLDFMFIDMPPGTGDAYISLLKNFPESEAVIVSQSQQMALIDTTRTVDLMQKINIKILGMVENMSIGSNKGNGQNFCKKHKINHLGQIGFDPEIAELSDQGKAFIDEDNKNSETLLKIIEKL